MTVFTQVVIDLWVVGGTARIVTSFLPLLYSWRHRSEQGDKSYHRSQSMWPAAPPISNSMLFDQISWSVSQHTPL